MDWFRLHSKVASVAKVQGLPIDMRWRWIECLCLANENDPRGTLPAIRQVAFTMRLSEDEAARVLEYLADAGLLDKSRGKYACHDWDHHQRKSDNSAVYKQKQRGRPKASRDTLDPPVQECPENVQGHSLDCPVPEKIREEEIRKDTPLPPTGGGVRGEIETDTGGPEPFDPGGVGPVDLPPPVRNAKADVDRVAAKADRIFPGLDFGSKVRQLQADYDVNVLEASMEDAFDSGVKSWKYISGVYRGRMTDGRGAARRGGKSGPAHPENPPPTIRFGVAELDAQRAAFEASVQAKRQGQR